MKAVLLTEPALKLLERPDPAVEAGEVRIAV
jgi:hypothetical protein